MLELQVFCKIITKHPRDFRTTRTPVPPLQKPLKKHRRAVYPLYFKKGMTAADVTAKIVADAAYEGDETAKEIYSIYGEQLEKELSVLIDILSPERIVIGSIFAHSENLLCEGMERVINKEAAAAVC